MRRLLTVILVIGAASTTMWRFAAEAGAESQTPGEKPKTFSLRIAATDGKAATGLPVFISTGDGAPIELGITNFEGELQFALDSSKLGKKYNAYRQDCQRIIWHEVGTDEDKFCRAESDKLGQSKAEEKNKCGSCVFLGPLTYGETTTVGTFSGGHTARNVAITGGAIGLATLGAIGLSGDGGAEGAAVTPVTPTVQTGAPAPPAPNPFVSLNGTYPNVLFLLQSGSCTGFAPQFAGTITVTDHSSDAATVIVRIVESITREYRGLIRNGLFEGTGNGAFASGRTWIGQLSALLSGGSARNAREVLNVGASATSPACTSTYAQ